MSSVIHVDQNSFDKEVLKADKPAIVDFFAEWCGPCRMMGPVLESAAAKLAGKAVICKLNTDQNEKLSIEYNISTIPCLILFKKGKEVKRLSGFRSESDLITWIES